MPQTVTTDSSEKILSSGQAAKRLGIPLSTLRSLVRYGTLRTTSMENGQEGLRVARECKDKEIRLAITDVIMPQMSGKVMAEWLKESCPDLKVLFTSGYTDDALVQHGMLEPGIAFLPKPYTAASLTHKVREILDHQ